METVQDHDERSVLETFCDINGIVLPETLENDIMAVDIDDVIEVWLLYLGEGEVEVFARIEGLDPDDPGTLRLLLEANYLGMATGGARLSVDPVDPHVVLSERWPYDRLLAPSAFEDLGRFAKIVSAWRAEGVAMVQSKIRGEDDPEDVPADVEILRL